MNFSICGQNFVLDALKAIYWQERNSLLIADLHLGKAEHFSSNGIPIPAGAKNSNFETLNVLIEKYQCKEVIFLGDLFHSKYNVIWQDTIAFINFYTGVTFKLVLGNHDILDHKEYIHAGLKLFNEPYILEPFTLSHHPIEKVSDHYNLHGHIHPAIVLKGTAKQSLRLPCFYFGKDRGILPAFGSFTGHGKIKFEKKDHLFAIANDEIIKLET